MTKYYSSALTKCKSFLNVNTQQVFNVSESLWESHMMNGTEKYKRTLKSYFMCQKTPSDKANESIQSCMFCSIYKDSYGASSPWCDYQLRPNSYHSNGCGWVICFVLFKFKNVKDRLFSSLWFSFVFKSIELLKGSYLIASFIWSFLISTLNRPNPT